MFTYSIRLIYSKKLLHLEKKYSNNIQNYFYTATLIKNIYRNKDTI